MAERLERLEFNLDSLQKFLTEINTLQEELQSLASTIQDEMVNLNAGWNTPAGRKFFENQDYQWADEVEHYVDILETLKGMIQYAHQRYSEVKETAEKIEIE